MQFFAPPYVQQLTQWCILAITKKKLTPNPPVKWQIVKQVRRYKPGQKTCNLCLIEKLYIVKNMNNTRSLNKRADVGNKCTKHRDKHFLDCYF